MYRITLCRMPYPEKNIHLQLQWFGMAIGLLGERDKDKSCFRIFIELLKAAKFKAALSSDELAQRTKLSRGTVVHHLNKLIDAGVVSLAHNAYSLRAENLSQLIEEVRRDANRTVDTLSKVAAELDRALGL